MAANRTSRSGGRPLHRGFHAAGGKMPDLFSTFSLKDITLKNRIAIPPLGQYSANDGVINDWHMVNLGAPAVGGAGLVIAENTAIAAIGRVTPGCAGLWNDTQAEAWSRVARFVKSQGAVVGIQLGHSGRKGCANPPWEGDDHIPAEDPRSWQTIAASPVAFGGKLNRQPREMTLDDIRRAQGEWAAAAKRALAAGFEWLEIHFAHGYLAQSFFSPLGNFRQDAYGGSFEGRARFLIETFQAVRAVWPERLPLTVRLGVTDFVPGGLQFEDSIELIRRLKAEGLDLIDISIGFNSPDASGIPWGTGFMVPYGEKIRRQVDIPVAIGWMIEHPRDADQIIRDGKADLIMIGRQILSDPRWPYHAAQILGRENPWRVLPDQYGAWLKRPILTACLDQFRTGDEGGSEPALRQRDAVVSAE
jgi:2,4-dienoyl-CoA reductase-like NADH-dependent reductase (Old Yellow Enzyme family)